jgi:hypothetical protein
MTVAGRQKPLGLFNVARSQNKLRLLFQRSRLAAPQWRMVQATLAEACRG